jgi:hypothetical protein
MNHDDYHAIEDAFVAGFRQAPDKAGFLRLARIPLELSPEGELGLKLVEVRLDESFAVGSASPGFASRELVYHPLPGTMIKSETKLAFRYVSSAGIRDLSLADVLRLSGQDHPHDGAEHGHHHHHHHHHHGH